MEKIRAGNSNIRNPILASYVAKGLLLYRGLGSGIKRALEDWPEIDFTDDRDGCLFTVTVNRKEEERSEKSSEKILVLLKAEPPRLAAREIAERLEITQRAVEKQIANLREDGRLRRIGSARGGHWEVRE
ncbi:HTH domain-containing protein [Methanoculleus chikugoensis]|uniref:HTH domain-containing protein n=1 Tax=Methanoculleus chikugoensis TaxID=118126 RepID=UPI0006D20AB6|nr:HTH domain-containing protein [Methanoculleus chikugoensis]